MFIELTEILRCPRDHPESYLVAAPIAMDGRRIVRGVIGCPECRAEFPIVDGVAYFAERPKAAQPPASSPPYDVAALTAFLNLGGPGGYAVLVGAAARFGAEIVAAVPGVHFVAVNPPPGMGAGPSLSVLVAAALPFKSSAVRAVALGAGHADAPWLREATRILLPGLRLAVEDERAGPDGVSELARGGGLFVGEKLRG
ncbi:MAG: Trm112 family protein [Gemmatimonadales bacterium]